MKKIVLSLAVQASVALVSCSKGAATTDSAMDTTAAPVEETTTVDTTVKDTTVKVEAPAEAATVDTKVKVEAPAEAKKAYR